MITSVCLNLTEFAICANFLCTPRLKMFNNSNKAREELSSTAVDKVVKDNKRFMLNLLVE